MKGWLEKLRPLLSLFTSRGLLGVIPRTGGTGQNVSLNQNSQQFFFLAIIWCPFDQGRSYSAWYWAWTVTDASVTVAVTRYRDSIVWDRYRATPVARKLDLGRVTGWFSTASDGRGSGMPDECAAWASRRRGGCYDCWLRPTVLPEQVTLRPPPGRPAGITAWAALALVSRAVREDRGYIPPPKF